VFGGWAFETRMTRRGAKGTKEEPSCIPTYSPIGA
jgi:hypothetical protein